MESYNLITKKATHNWYGCQCFCFPFPPASGNHDSSTNFDHIILKFIWLWVFWFLPWCPRHGICAGNLIWVLFVLMGKLEFGTKNIALVLALITPWCYHAKKNHKIKQWRNFEKNVDQMTQQKLLLMLCVCWLSLTWLWR